MVDRGGPPRAAAGGREIRTASRGPAADESRALSPSEACAILYRIAASPLTARTEPCKQAGAGSDLPSAPRRPGESYGRPDVSLATRRALAIASADASVPLDVAATLICEAGLLLDRLEQRRVRCARSLLDQAACSSRVTRALTAANADYLRALSCRSWRRDRSELDLPVRVLARVGDRLEQRLARCELLEAAIRWEIGALLSERSMGNWGSEVVLAGSY